MATPKSARRGAASKLPRCRRCGKSIRVPKGWSTGPAVRRHYWRMHRDVMQPETEAGR